MKLKTGTSLRDSVDALERELVSGDRRSQVTALRDCFRALRGISKSLEGAPGLSARDRILEYLKRYPRTVIAGDELMVVSGINDYARRIRELKTEYGWRIVNGSAAKLFPDELGQLADVLDLDSLRPSDYILLSTTPDASAAGRWRIANRVRKQSGTSRERILEYLKLNVGRPVKGEELHYVSREDSNFEVHVADLSSEAGWPICIGEVDGSGRRSRSFMLETLIPTPVV